jgi:hypothetical protein
MAYMVLDTTTNIMWHYKKATSNAWLRVGGSITSGLTGVLPVANGGTGASLFSPNNYLIRTNSSGIFDTSAVYEAGGRVGIGTTTPQSLLQVGSISSASSVGPTDWNQVARFTSTNRKTSIVIQGSGTDVSTNQGLPAIEFDPYAVDASGRIKTAIVAIDNYFGYRKTDLAFVLDSADDLNPWGISDTKMIIKNGGNVGIGTTTPTSRLYVKGLTNTSEESALNVTNSSDVSLLNVRNDGLVSIGSGANNGVANNWSVFRGVGVNDGSANYGNYGGFILNANNEYSTSSKQFLITNAYNISSFAIIRSTNATTKPSLGVAGAVSSGVVDFSISNTGVATFSSSVNATTGTFSSVGAGAYSNDLNITSTGVLTTASSDEKYKYNILPINYGLNTILQLKPVNFQWIKGEENDLGFIAQDVAEIIPEAVDTNWNSDLLMRYESIIPILTKAIQEQQALIKALEQRIINLENK